MIFSGIALYHLYYYGDNYILCTPSNPAVISLLRYPVQGHSQILSCSRGVIFAIQRSPWSLDWLSKKALIAWFNLDSGHKHFNTEIEVTTLWEIIWSHKPHSLQSEEGSGHATTIELLPQQKPAVTNEIHRLCRLHPLSWSSNYVTMCLADVSILLSNCDVRSSATTCQLQQDQTQTP